MNLDRKTFLRSLGVGAAGLLAARQLGASGSQPESTIARPVWKESDPESFWQQVRAQFSLTTERTYFNTGGLGPASRRALDKFATISRQLQEQVETGHEHFAEARGIAAGYFGAKPDELCFTRNCTEGTCVVATGLKLRAGDEVILDSQAHPGGSFPWLNRQSTEGIVVKLFEPQARSAADNLERIAALITPRTRVIQVSHIMSPTGILMPVREIGRLAEKHNAWFHVDGAQSAGMIPVNLATLGCDSFATSGHKWIGGPHETGVLWIRGSKLDQVTPRQVGAYSGGDIDLRHPGLFEYSPGARRYEYGTRNAASVMALAEAMQFQDEIGRERIAARGHLLAQRVREGFSKIDSVEILTPADPALRGSILTFRSPKLAYGKIFSALLKDHHLRTRPVAEIGLDAIRVSTHLFNSPEECDRLIGALDEVLKQA